jgi:hypothetical protein
MRTGRQSGHLENVASTPNLARLRLVLAPTGCAIADSMIASVNRF